MQATAASSMSSNYIPYLPSSPPPLDGGDKEDDDDDEFGTFTCAGFSCDGIRSEEYDLPVKKQVANTSKTCADDESSELDFGNSKVNLSNQNTVVDGVADEGKHRKSDRSRSSSPDVGSTPPADRIGDGVSALNRVSAKELDIIETNPIGRVDSADTKLDCAYEKLGSSSPDSVVFNSTNIHNNFVNETQDEEEDWASFTVTHTGECEDLQFEDCRVTSTVDDEDLFFNSANALTSSSNKLDKDGDEKSLDDFYFNTDFNEEEENELYTNNDTIPSDNHITHHTASAVQPETTEDSCLDLKNNDSLPSVATCEGDGGNDSEEFDEFVSLPPASAVPPNCTIPDSTGSDNGDVSFEAEFDDEFGTFNSATLEPPSQVDHSSWQPAQILVETFPSYPSVEEQQVTQLEDLLSSEEVTVACSQCSRSLWLNLVDVEKTNALTYHWDNSNASKKLMKALNIDSRNLLFGHNWNSSVPIFAANLSFNPLEPTKTCLTSEERSEESEPPRTSSLQDVIPPAQFDWTSSGLVNPLDGLEHELLGPNSEPPIPPRSPVDSKLSPLLEQILSSAKLSSGVKPKTSLSVSAEAQQVLNKLPDLSFMQAKVLMFPIRSSSP